MYKIIWSIFFLLSTYWLIQGIWGSLGNHSIYEILYVGTIIFAFWGMMLFIQNMRISKIEEYIRSLNLKNTSNKISQNIKKEIGVLRWVVTLLGVIVFALITFQVYMCIQNKRELLQKFPPNSGLIFRKALN